MLEDAESVNQDTSVRQHEIGFRILLRDATADAVIRTLERLGGTRSEQYPWWFFPSNVDNRVKVGLSVASGEASKRLGLSLTIQEFDGDESFEECWADVLSRGLSIPSAVALRLIRDAAAWLYLTTSDRESALGLLPTLIEALLTEHEGNALGDHGVWTSDDIHSGRLTGLAHWPFLSITQEFDLSQAVLVGKVVRQEERMNEYMHRERKYVLNVEETLRATLPPTIEVYSGIGFPMVIGKRYLLFLHCTQGRLEVSPLGNSEVLPGAAETLSVVRNLAASRTGGGG